jgi:hypothetical protein
MGEIKNAQKKLFKKYDERNREGSRWVNNIDPLQPSGCIRFSIKQYHALPKDCVCGSGLVLRK